ncbi:MAG: hypothetical protein Q7S33_01435 [Nanoarchaeota archaeon]|nr:hypothetical protein [Nanoarchaeota archaeon]
MDKKQFILFFALIFIFLIVGVYAQETIEKKAYFFYSSGCSHCANVEASGVLNNPNVIVERINVYENQQNRDKFLEYNNKFNIPELNRGWPFVVIECNGNSSYLLGDKSIIENFEKDIESCKNISTSGTGVNPANPSKTNLTFGIVIMSALVDGLVNPCALGVLAFLLIILSLQPSKKRMIKVVFVYISTIFVVYFLSGLGLFSALQSLKITNMVYYISIIVLLIAALINIKDYFYYGKGLSLAIPESQKPLIEKYAKIATPFSAFILGFLVALFELPCTGIWYLAILSMLSDSMTRISAIPWLLLYNFIFVLPLIVISSFVIWKFSSAEEIQNWSQDNKKIFRLIMGLIMLAVAIAMFFLKN